MHLFPRSSLSTSKLHDVSRGLCFCTSRVRRELRRWITSGISLGVDRTSFSELGSQFELIGECCLIFRKVKLGVTSTVKLGILLQNPPVSFSVDNLQPDASYRVLLFAVNSKGRAEPFVFDGIYTKDVPMLTETDIGRELSPFVAGTIGTTAVLIIILFSSCATVGCYYRNSMKRKYGSVVGLELCFKVYLFKSPQFSDPRPHHPPRQKHIKK